MLKFILVVAGVSSIVLETELTRPINQAGFRIVKAVLFSVPQSMGPRKNFPIALVANL